MSQPHHQPVGQFKGNRTPRRAIGNVTLIDLDNPDGVTIRRVSARYNARAAALAQQFAVATPLGYPPRLICTRCQQYVLAQAPRDDLVAFVTKHEDCTGSTQEDTSA